MNVHEIQREQYRYRHTVDGFISVICACDSCTPVASPSVCFHVRVCLRACVFLHEAQRVNAVIPQCLLTDSGQASVSSSGFIISRCYG